MNHFYNNAVLAIDRPGVKKIVAALFLMLAFSFSPNVQAQLMPQLVFQNPTLEAGSAGADGAVYRFSNVATGIDALVIIVQRSGGNVTLSNIDITSSGSANAFQPQVNRFGNNSNSSWYMDFAVHFVAAGTTNELPAGSGIIYKATIYDIDGDGQRIREFVEAYEQDGYQVDPSTQLAISPSTVTYGSNTYSGTQFLGPVTNYTDIDVNAPLVSATINYTNRNLIGFRIGASNSTGTSSTAAARYSSILFNNFLYIAPGTLPVDLISFSARLNKDEVVLDWTTANEVNFSHFTIQRSTDGKSFTDIGTVAGKQSSGSANTLYSYTDDTDVQSTIVYYRLKMVDQDATYKYSAIKQVNKSQAVSKGSVQVYPNPVASELRVSIPTSWQGKKVSYIIYNGNGVVIRQQVINSASQTELFNLSGVPAGFYTIRVTKDAETIVKQFVKN